MNMNTINVDALSSAVERFFKSKGKGGAEQREKGRISAPIRKCGGGGVLIWGASKKSSDILSYFLENGIEVSGYIDKNSRQIKKFQDRTVYEKEIIKTGRFFVYVALNETYEDIIQFLEESGYSEFEDYWYPERKIALDGEKEYHDPYGNEYRGGGHHFSLVLRKGGRVSIGPGCKISPDTEVEVVEDSEVVISENSVMDGKMEISCSSGSRIKFGRKNIFEFPAMIECGRQSEIEVGDNFYAFIGAAAGVFRCLFYSKIRIGEGMTVGHGYDISCVQNSAIEIGDDCMLSRCVLIRAGGGHNLFDLEKGINLSSIGKKVKVGKHVWIGQNAVLFSGCEVGPGSVVGFHTFVNKAFPENCSIAGNPAKIVNSSVAWRRETYCFYKRKEDFQEFDYRA